MYLVHTDKLQVSAPLAEDPLRPAVTFGLMKLKFSISPFMYSCSCQRRKKRTTLTRVQTYFCFLVVFYFIFLFKLNVSFKNLSLWEGGGLFDYVPTGKVKCLYHAGPWGWATQVLRVTQ
jgi:hypothetical protein